MNEVLRRLLEARAAQVAFVSTLLERVETESRDLVDAERSNLEGARQRITELDAQIVPLEEFEATAAAHRSAVPAPVPTRTPAAGRGTEGLGIAPREVVYRTAGEFLVDYVRGNDPQHPDTDALQRVAASRQGAQVRAAGDVAPGAHQTTADTPPLLPTLVVGEILDNLDASRPFIASVGAKSLADRPGMVFNRPYITQHTLVGEQTAEKAELPTRDLKMASIPFTKRTFGGHINISRQAIDWTDPSAWDAVVTDLETQYGLQTEDTYGAEFAAGVTQTTAVTFANAGNVNAYIDAFYAAAVKAATANGTRRAAANRFADHIWTSLDQWAAVGSMLSKLAITAPQADPGNATPFAFTGQSILDTPRTMVPGFPANTIIIGKSGLYEFYEQRIGLLQAVEPKVLGVDVAYGGYAAGNFLDPTAFVKIAVATA